MLTFLVATDFTPRSDRAIRRAVLAARKAGARLALVHAMAKESDDAITLERKADRLQTLLAESADTIIHHDGVPCEYRLITGSECRALTETARELSAELIVLGPHKPNLLEDVFLGTIAELVLKEAPYPVLIANGVPSATYSNILIATDFSDSSMRAALTADAIGLLEDVRVIASHAFETQDPGGVQPALISLSDDPQASERHEAEQAMREYVRATGIAPSKTVIVPMVTATAEMIRRIAERERADLVVIGTNRRSGIEKFVLGSVAQDFVRDAIIDVLVVPIASA
ncbi:universal stress protein [Sphingobium sp. D43FB]|uniref:universal stress protein n=1 Tax=Sphingobium sp. D43FB TaxID=2017595 RepID=UPI001596C49E|nr:universal stress protein [Sphingobium sp. D43FB]